MSDVDWSGIATSVGGTVFGGGTVVPTRTVMVGGVPYGGDGGVGYGNLPGDWVDTSGMYRLPSTAITVTADDPGAGVLAWVRDNWLIAGVVVGVGLSMMQKKGGR